MLLNLLSKIPLFPEIGLWADRNYLRLWTAMSITSLGGQVTMLAIPLTAAVLLNATPMQMGILTAVELLPFALVSLPAGVWLDRSRKLPIVLGCEALFVLTLTTIAALAWLHQLTMGWLYGLGFLIGCLHVVGGSASQILLTQIVPREKLVEAHSKNALAQSIAEVGGPSLAGLLIQVLTAPIALLVDAAAFLFSVLLIRTIKVTETAHLNTPRDRALVAAIQEGLRFVWRTPVLRSSALVVGMWQVLHMAYHTVIVLFATRILGFSAATLGVLYTFFGVGSLLASAKGEALGKRYGIGPCMAIAVLATAVAWMLFAVTPVGMQLGYISFAAAMACFGFGAALLFIHFLSLRQAVTPEQLLGRMTSTMRFLIIAGAPVGSLLGGAIAQWTSLRSALAFAAVGGFALAWYCRGMHALMSIRTLPPKAPSR